MTSNFKTWTRKGNAIAAVKKIAAASGVDYPSTLFEAVEDEGGFKVVVFCKTDLFAATKKALWGVSEVFEDTAENILIQTAIGCPTGETKAEKPIAEVAESKTPAKKVSNKGGRKVFLNGDKNPFRAGNGSWKTFEHVRANPGITFDELKEAKGIRMRAVSHCLQMGWFKVEG